MHSYQSNLRSAKAEVFSKLSAISNIIGTQINGDIHQRIVNAYLSKDGIKSSKQDQDYQAIHEQLVEIKKVSGINTDIYTLFPTKDFKKFYFGVSSSEVPYFRHLYRNPPAALIDSYNTGGTIDEYKDENGDWLSAFTPIRNSKNQVVAVVQLDKNFSEFKSDITNRLIKNILVIFVCYSVIGFLLFLFLKDILGKEEIYIRSQTEYTEILTTEVDLRTRELSVANDKLNKLNKELESFFYSTSHDIRGPLCRILGLSSLAKMETDKQQFVELIEQESQKMDEMLKKMILVNNIRTKNLSVSPIKVSETVGLALTGLKAKYKFEKQEIVFVTKSNHLNGFNCDLELFESIIVNLLDNAFKFCDETNPIIKVNSFIDDNGIFSLSVKNNGKVFSEIERNNAFELFKRANKQGDMDTLRLGLYAIKTSLDRLNGLIDIYSEESFTEIRVMIPDYLMNEKINRDLKSQANLAI